MSKLTNKIFFQKFKKEPKLARGVSVYLENPKGDFLLHLRTADVREPNKWTPISGALALLEDPQTTLVRETKEELGVVLKKFKFFRDYFWINDDEKYVWYNHNFVFWAKINLSLKQAQTVFNEGPAINYFSIDKILKMNLAFNHDQTFRNLIDWLGYQSK